ncbi:Transcriptional elongation regulator MINIYO [Nymphaea thermarum]|nr:Transcriptional elongation regulator MINIYO [Nymphaea thermarum]
MSSPSLLFSTSLVWESPTSAGGTSRPRPWATSAFNLQVQGQPAAPPSAQGETLFPLRLLGHIRTPIPGSHEEPDTRSGHLAAAAATAFSLLLLPPSRRALCNLQPQNVTGCELGVAQHVDDSVDCQALWAYAIGPELILSLSAKPSNIIPFKDQSMDDENDEEHTIKDDVIVGEHDIAAGLMRMGMDHNVAADE